MDTVVTYLGHSGFLVEANGHQMIFDYLGEGLDEGKLKNAVVFISHAHKDHCSREALELIRRGAASGVVSFDVGASDFYRTVRPMDVISEKDIRISTFGSTDQGVSFLAETGDVSIFHAGDLNYWHWREESTPSEIEDAWRAFDEILGTIEGHRVDIAMFPVDPRMGDRADEGAMEFARRIRPGVLIPMHFWDRSEYARYFCEKQMPFGVRAVFLEKPGNRFLDSPD